MGVPKPGKAKMVVGTTLRNKLVYPPGSSAPVPLNEFKNSVSTADYEYKYFDCKNQMKIKNRRSFPSTQV